MATLGTEGAWLFGVSMGLLISSKNPNIEDWDPLVNELKSEFLTAGITIYIDGEGVPIGVNPWRLTTSDALSKNSSPGQWYVAVYTPVFDFRSFNTWGPLLQLFWKVLSEKFNTDTNNHCGTHISVLPASGYWRLDHLKAISKSILYYESCMDIVLPGRNQVTGCASNRSSYRFIHPKLKNLHEIFEEISHELIDNGDKIARLMCSIGLADGEICTDHRFRWSFRELEEGPEQSGTNSLVFRQPPGSKNYEELQRYISLTIAFVEAAILRGGNIEPEEELRDISRRHSIFRLFLADGAKSAKMTGLLYQGLAPILLNNAWL